MKAMTDVPVLLTQIARAKRFAAAMTNDAEKERFTVISEELEGELLRCQETPGPSCQTLMASLQVQRVQDCDDI